MELLQLWDSVWIALLASAILYGVYRAVEWRWPERYVGMTQTFGLSSQETWLRFVAYRAGPTYLFAATSFVTVERIGGSILISGVVMWVSGVLLTHGRVILHGLVRKWGEVNYAGYHLLMMALLTLTMLLAAWSAPAWGAVVPPPDELLSAAWSGLVVAGLGGFAVFVLRPRGADAPEYDAAYFVERATRDVGIGALDWLYRECIRTGADPVLLKAMLVVEAVQRPRWARRLERVLIRMGIGRTSGVMQMPGAEPLSDRASITAAADRYAGTWIVGLNGPAGYESWSTDLGDAWSVVTAHNGDIDFATSVREVADHLVGSLYGHWAVASEREPLVLEVRRLPERFLLRGISTSDELTLLQLNGTAHFTTIAAPGARASGAWWAWECAFAPSTRTLLVSDRVEGVGVLIRLRDGEVLHAQSHSRKDFEGVAETS